MYIEDPNLPPPISHCFITFFLHTSAITRNSQHLPVALLCLSPGYLRKSMKMWDVGEHDIFQASILLMFPHTHTENSEVPIKVDRCGSGSNTASIGEVTTFILCFYDENVFPKTFVQLSRSSPPCHESVAKATLPMSGQTRARLLLH